MTRGARHANALPISFELHCPAASLSFQIALFSYSTAPLLQPDSRGEQLPSFRRVSPPSGSLQSHRSGRPVLRVSSCVLCLEAPNPVLFNSSAVSVPMLGHKPDQLDSCVTSPASGSQLPVAITLSPLQKLREMRDGGVRARVDLQPDTGVTLLGRSAGRFSSAASTLDTTQCSKSAGSSQLSVSLRSDISAQTRRTQQTRAGRKQGSPGIHQHNLPRLNATRGRIRPFDHSWA